MIPKIGNAITVDKVLELYRSFELYYLVDRIEIDSSAYKFWEFDDASEILEMESCLEKNTVTYWLLEYINN